MKEKKKNRQKRTYPSSGGAEQGGVGKWASVAASCTKAKGREHLLVPGKEDP